MQRYVIKNSTLTIYVSWTVSIILRILSTQSLSWLRLIRIWFLQKKIVWNIFPIIFFPNKISGKFCPKIQSFKIATKHFKFIKGLPKGKLDNFVFCILRCKISNNNWFKSHSWITLIETVRLIPILLWFMTFMSYVMWHKCHKP